MNDEPTTSASGSSRAEGLSWQIKGLLLLLLVAIALVIGGFGPRSDGLRRLVQQPVSVPDAIPFYDRGALEGFLERIRSHPGAAKLYARTQVTLDGVFPFVYCGALFLLLQWLLGRSSGVWKRKGLRRFVFLLPLVPLVSDLLENLLLRSLSLADLSSTAALYGAMVSSWTKWGSLVLIVLVILCLLGEARSSLLQAAFLCRVPLLAAAIVWVLAAATSNQPTLSNMRIARRGLDLVAIGFFATLVAAMVGLNVLMVLRFSPERHGLDRRIADDIMRNTARPIFRDWPLLALVPSAVVAWPLFVAVWRSTVVGSEVEGLTGFSTAVYLLLGSLSGVGLLLLIQRLWKSLRGRDGAVHSPSGFGSSILEQRGVRVLASLWRGQNEESGNEVDGTGHAKGYGPPRDHLPGHLFSAILLTILFALYFVWYFLFEPPDRATWLPALASLLALLMLMSSLLSGASFFFDRFRFPLILALVLWTLLISRLFPRDHLFEVRRLSSVPVTTEQILEQRLGLVETTSSHERSHEPKTMTVVLGVGGGIVASAWTSQVLTGLHETYGQSFTDSIVLMSTVSGSSVGAYYYLEALRAGEGVLDAKAIAAIRQASVGSSLEETAWGLAFPDLLRGFFPMLVPAEKDRAWASERAWVRHRNDMLKTIRDSDSPPSPEEEAWLSSWIEAAQRGHLPGVILNATVVEDGELFLLSNADLAPLARRRFDPTLEHHFAKRCPAGDCLYPMDLRAVTAARMSSTFPYASPIARGASDDGELERVAGWHAADGGYIDNIGAVAAIAWLRHALDEFSGQRPPRVAVLLLNGFPEWPDHLLDVNQSRSWTFATLGPLHTLLNVRNTSQVMRAHFELDLLEHEDNVPADQAGPNQHPTISVIEIRPSFDGGADPQPVSWSLSPRDIRGVEQNWQERLPCLAAELERLGLYGEANVGECSYLPSP